MMEDVKRGNVSSAAGFDGQAGEAAGARPLFTDGRRWQVRGSKKLEDKKEGFTLTLVSESLSSSGPYDKKDGLKLVRSFSEVLTNMCKTSKEKKWCAFKFNASGVGSGPSECDLRHRD